VGEESEFLVLSKGKVIGAAVRAATAAFNDDITALVGVGADGRISGVKILTNTETPGLGANAGLDHYYIDKAAGITFYGQFAGLSAAPADAEKLAVQKDGGRVVAITAATITSRTVSLIVRTAGEAAAKYLEVNAQ
jgi:electron transport complex protein RnfG